MRPTFRTVVLAMAVAMTAGCASLLGIDEFIDATASTGTAGTAGTGGGTGGTTTSGTTTGTAGTGGNGGEPAAHLWSHRYGDDGAENAAGVVVTDIDTIVVAGDFTSSIDFGGGAITNSHAADRDAFVAMVESDGSHRWTDHISGSDEEVIESMAIDASNNILLAGWYRDELLAPRGADSLGAYGNDEFFVMQLDPGGDYQWGFRPVASSGQVEHATGVAAGPGNDVVVVGYFEDWVEFDTDHHELLSNHGPDNAVVAAFDSGGDYLWSDDFGVWGHQRPAGVATFDDGNVIIVGNCSGGVTDQIDCSSPTDVFVARYDLTHSLADAVVFGDGDVQDPHAVATSGDELVVVGGFESQIDFDPNATGALTSHGSFDLFVAKLGSDLSHVWSHGFGGLEDDIAYDVAIDAAGRVLVTGVIRDTVDFGDGAHVCSDGDVFLLVLDQNGNLEYSRRFGEAGDQEGRGVAVDSDGNIVVFGNMQGAIDFGGGLLTSEGGGQDVFLVKLSP